MVSLLCAFVSKIQFSSSLELLEHNNFTKAKIYSIKYVNLVRITHRKTHHNKYTFLHFNKKNTLFLFLNKSGNSKVSTNIYVY